MHFVYLDETGDDSCIGFSALCVPVLSYRESFQRLKQYRRDLNRSDGIYTTTEVHACKFTSGRGRLGQKGRRGIRQKRRCLIFNEILGVIANLPNASLMNAFRLGNPVQEREQLLERLLNRIQKSMEVAGSQALLFFDEGGNRWITRLCRRMAVFNLIRSNIGRWEDGQEYKNLPTANLFEDPIFRPSNSSYLIQAADFCAYALLQKEKPTASRVPFGLHQSFVSALRPICNTAASPDPLGIVR